MQQKRLRVGLWAGVIAQVSLVSGGAMVVAGCGREGRGVSVNETPAPRQLAWAVRDLDDPSPWTRRLLAHPLIHPAGGTGPNGGDAIRVDYAGYERGSRRVVLQHPLPRAAEEMTLCYNVRFAEDFQFVRGGKLHGLGPANRITGGRPMRPDGWSARVMFRAGGSLHTYLYTQDKNSKWGVGRKAEGFRFEKGRWYAVSIHVRLNSAAEKADGFTHVYVDGRRVIEHNDVRFRGRLDPATRISQALFSTFHGGNKPAWSPTDAEGNFVTVHAWFHDLAVYEGLHVRGPVAQGVR